MIADALLQWKSQIFDYQQRTRESVPPQQTALFDIAPKHCDPDRIDPLPKLALSVWAENCCNIAFWWDTPTERRSRQQLEQALIQKWKSPFNTRKLGAVGAAVWEKLEKVGRSLSFALQSSIQKPRG